MDYTFFSNALGTFFKIDHKRNLNKFKKTEFLSRIYSNQNCMKVETNYRKKTGKNTIWRLNNCYQTTNGSKEIKYYFETNENENSTFQNLWNETKAIIRGKFIAMQAYFKK